MDSKTWVKFSLLVFLLLATSFETLEAQSETDILRDGCLSCKGKQSWPELIGVPANLAKETIEKDNSLVQKIQIVLIGSPVTADFTCFRVRLAVNILNIVVQIPKVG